MTTFLGVDALAKHLRSRIDDVILLSLRAQTNPVLGILSGFEGGGQKLAIILKPAYELCAPYKVNELMLPHTTKENQKVIRADLVTRADTGITSIIGALMESPTHNCYTGTGSARDRVTQTYEELQKEPDGHKLLGAYLHAKREANTVTMDEIASKLQLHRTSVYRLEGAKPQRLPKLCILQPWLECLNATREFNIETLRKYRQKK